MSLDLYCPNCHCRKDRTAGTVYGDGCGGLTQFRDQLRDKNKAPTQAYAERTAFQRYLSLQSSQRVSGKKPVEKDSAVSLLLSGSQPPRNGPLEDGKDYDDDTLAFKRSRLEACLFNSKSTFDQDLVTYVARTPFPGEASFRVETFEPATRSPRRPFSPGRRAEVAQTRRNGACDRCRGRKSAVSRWYTPYVCTHAHSSVKVYASSR